MADWSSSNKFCSAQQARAALGITVLAVWSLVATAELPVFWAAILGTSQGLGLAIAAVCSVCCFYASPYQLSYQRGSGVLCEKCHLPSLSGTQHCEVCAVCVSGFSHHSDWLNCCIGTGNAGAYLGVVGGLALATASQTAAVVGLWALMLGNRDLAVRLGQKYALRDQGYLYHLLLLFFLLVSASLAIASLSNLVLHLCRLLSQWKRPRKPVFQLNSATPHIDSCTPVLRSEGESAFCSPWKTGEDPFDPADVTFRGARRFLPANTLLGNSLSI